MSELKVDTLTGKTSAGDITVTVGATATQSLEQGLVKAFILYDQLSGTASSVGSFNISGLVDGALGIATVSYSSIFGAVDYCHLVGTSTDGGSSNGSGVSRHEYGSPATTGSMEIVVEVANSAANDDRDFNSVAFVGSLA